MKHVPVRVVLIAALTTCVFFSASTQTYTTTNLPKYEFGINLGFTVYQGDLTPRRLGSFETQKLALGLHASRIMSASFSIRANFLWGKLKGDDAKYEEPEFRQQRNFNFTSPVVELSGQLVWNPLHRNYADKGFSPYVFAGAGLSYVNIKRDWSNFNAAYFSTESVSEIEAGLAIDSAHSLPRILPVVPVGLGIKYFFTQRLAAHAETSYRFGFSDYMDGFSRSANPQKNDHYLNYSIGVIYRTGKKNTLACPVIRY